MHIEAQEQGSSTAAGVLPTDDGAELRNNAVLSAPSARLPNTVLVRCSSCGVAQHLSPTQGAEVGEWMPCSLCWRSLTREARLAYLPRFKTLSGDDQKPWRHRFTLIGVTEAELRQEAPQELEASAKGEGEAQPTTLDELQPSAACEGQAQQLTDDEPPPPRCALCGCILHEGVHAA
jgi:hypothetical protein